MDSSRSLSLNEALNTIFPNLTRNSRYDDTLRGSREICFSCSRPNTLRLQSEANTVAGLTWIAKGLLMRGHEKVKDMTMALLSYLTLGREAGDSKDLQNLIDDFDEVDMHQLRISAENAFHIIMSDSGECLNRMYHAIIRPLYKQQFFRIIMPIFLSLMVKSDSPSSRSMLHRAFAHGATDTPMSAILGEAKKLVPILLDCLSMLSKDAEDREMIYNVLLIMSGILLD